MTNEETIGKLIAMRLTAMANAFREQLKAPATVNLSFEERLGLLTDIEWTSRKNHRLKKLIQPPNLTSHKLILLISTIRHNENWTGSDFQAGCLHLY